MDTAQNQMGVLQARVSVGRGDLAYGARRDQGRLDHSPADSAPADSQDRGAYFCRRSPINHGRHLPLAFKTATGRPTWSAFQNQLTTSRMTVGDP